MNLQLFLAIVAAVVIVVASYQSLKWSVIIWLGGLFAVACGVALFLHVQNDSITWSIPVGDGLFRRGESTSILGEYGWLSWIGFLTGIALMAAGLVKRIRMPSPEPAAPVAEKPLTEREKIEQALDEEIERVQSALGDPAAHGKQDAFNPNGAMPDINATEPQGFESDSRGHYQAVGSSFVLNTVVRLKTEIQEALRTLSNLKNTLVKNYYANKASADYRENVEQPDLQRVANLRLIITKAGKEEEQFRETLQLAPGQQADWDNPTPLQQLIGLGSLFALIEFGVSYYFLKDEIGTSSAIGVAAVAVVIVFILAFLAAFVFSYMRPPTKMKIRALASFGYALFLIFLFLGLGLLLEYRTAETVEFSVRFEKIVGGYSSILSSINNLVLFLINLIAFGLFYWKFLLRFERFQGYRRIGKNLSQAEEEWRAIFNNNSTSIKNSLNRTSSEATNNKETATQAVKDLQEKKDVLENIQAIIEPAFVQKLRPAYHDNVNAYRTSNSNHRNVQVNPPPNYFNQPPHFCEADEHFSKDQGIDEFLSSHQEDIAQASDTCQKIEDKATDWQNERAQLNSKWATEFRRKIDGVKQ